MPQIRPTLFCTLFYANYLTRALALYRSLEKHIDGDFTLVMLCMDEASERILSELHLARARLLPIRELQRCDSQLAALAGARSVAEYAWTSTPALLAHLLAETRDGESIVYLDADLMFFSDPQPAFEEWGENDILIHEHRYAPRNRHMAKDSGIYNVGMVGLRAAPQARQCVTRWRSQCIDACTLDPLRGLCGDQKYLDEWPTLYDRLTVAAHKGVGLAPWNLEQYRLSSDGDTPRVDGDIVVFFHYHALRILADGVMGRTLVIPSIGYEFTRLQTKLLYRPYVKALREAYAEIRAAPTGHLMPRNRPSLSELKAYRRRLFLG